MIPNKSQALDGGEGPVVLALVLFAQLPPVQGGDRGGWLGEGSARIDGEVAVVRMLSAKVIARLRLCLGVGEDRLQLLDEFLQILAGKFSAEPKYQTWYVAHGGESLGNLAVPRKRNVGKRDFTAFLLRRQVPQSPSTARPGRPPLNPQILPTKTNKGGESPNPRFSRKIRRLPAMRSGIFGRTVEAIKMLKMKIGLDESLKTKGRKKWSG